MSGTRRIVIELRPVSAAVAPTAVTTTVKPQYVTQEAYDTLVDKLGKGDPALDLFRVRPLRQTTRALRAAGAGGTCPYYGLDFTNKQGVHHPADCGKERDGKFAKVGARSSAGKPGSGFEGHMEWASETDPKVLAAAKAAAKAKSA